MRGVLLLLYLSQTAFETGILREFEQSFIVDCNCVVIAFEEMQGGALSGIALGKLGIEPDARDGIFKCIVGISLFEVSS
jgi:hypothetical protein